MSASGGGTDWISRLNDLNSISDLDSALTRLLFLPVAAFFVQLANGVEAISQIIIAPAQEFAVGVAGIANSLLGGSADVIGAGASASASDVSVFGIGGFPVAIGIAFLAAFIIATFLEQDQTSDLIPFTFTDIPFLGVNEDEDS